MNHKTLSIEIPIDRNNPLSYDFAADLTGKHGVDAAVEDAELLELGESLGVAEPNAEDRPYSWQECADEWDEFLSAIEAHTRFIAWVENPNGSGGMRALMHRA